MTDHLYYDELYEFLFTQLTEPKFKQNDGVNFMLEQNEFPTFKLSPKFEHIYVYDKNPVEGTYFGAKVEAGLLSLSCESHENLFGMRFIIRDAEIDEKNPGQSYICFLQSRTRVHYGMIFPHFSDEEDKKRVWEIRGSSIDLNKNLENAVTERCENWINVERPSAQPPVEQVKNLLSLTQFISTAIWPPNNVPNTEDSDLDDNLETTDPTLPP